MNTLYLVIYLFIELSKVSDKLIPLFTSASLLVALVTVLTLLFKGKS